MPESFTAAADQGVPLVTNSRACPVSLHGAGTSWNASTLFTVTGPPEVAITAQQVDGPASATVWISTSWYPGTAWISDGAASATIAISGVPGLGQWHALSDPALQPTPPPQVATFNGIPCFGAGLLAVVELGGGWQISGTLTGPTMIAVSNAAATLTALTGITSVLQIPTARPFPDNWERHYNCAWQPYNLTWTSPIALGPGNVYQQSFTIVILQAPPD